MLLTKKLGLHSGKSSCHFSSSALPSVPCSHPQFLCYGEEGMNPDKAQNYRETALG